MTELKEDRNAVVRLRRLLLWLRDAATTGTTTRAALENHRRAEEALEDLLKAPLQILLWCPECGGRHVDVGEFATKAHHTHACQLCGRVWRPAIGATVGVQFLPGFKND